MSSVYIESYVHPEYGPAIPTIDGSSYKVHAQIKSLPRSCSGKFKVYDTIAILGIYIYIYICICIRLAIWDHRKLALVESPILLTAPCRPRNASARGTTCRCRSSACSTPLRACGLLQADRVHSLPKPFFCRFPIIVI